MIVYLVGALVALVYFNCIPLTAGLDISADERVNARLGLGFFDRTWILEITPGPRPAHKKPRRARLLEQWRKIPWVRLLRAMQKLWNRTRVLHLRARVSAGDACRTALACGAVGALFALCRLPGRVTPDFSAVRPSGRVTCIVSARIGHITIAALSCALILTQWRIKTWISARLKAS